MVISISVSPPRDPIQRSKTAHGVGWIPHNKGPRKQGLRSLHSSHLVGWFRSRNRQAMSIENSWLLNIDPCTCFFIYSSIYLSNIYMFTWICGLRLKVMLTVVLMHRYLYWAVKIEIEWQISWHCLPIHKIQGAKLKCQHCDSEYWKSILRTGIGSHGAGGSYPKTHHRPARSNLASCSRMIDLRNYYCTIILSHACWRGVFKS